MSTKPNTNPLALVMVVLVVASTAMFAGVAEAAVTPVKLLPSGSLDNGFVYTSSVAVDNDPASAEYGDVYVLDKGNHRVQVLTPAGVFVEMFGKEVNATTKGNICTAASKDTCQAGIEGVAAGQFSTPRSVMVDPVSGDVYVAEITFAEGVVGRRVQKFTTEGRFVLEIGKEVNQTHKTNLCTEEEVEKEGVQCGAPASLEVGGPGENGAFQFVEGPANLLAVGHEGKLYVGEEHRVQEFEANGKWTGEISLAGISSARDVQGLALDEETGDVYLVYGEYEPPGQDPNIIREFNAEGSELGSFQVSPREPGHEVAIGAIAVDGDHHIAVVAQEETISGGERSQFGALYATEGDRLLTEFTIPNGTGVRGVAFSGEGDLYAADAENPFEVFAYTPKPVAELVVSPGSCSPSGGVSVTFDCTLAGEANPEGVAETETLFEWGATTALGETTTVQQVAAPEAVHAVLAGLRPNQTFYYRLAGHDENAKAPEGLQSERASLATPTVAPRILGTPSVSYVTASSAVLAGEVNPENTTTTYEFQYAKACTPGEPCPPIAQAPGMVQTASVQSAVYGATGATQEITGLQPATSYRYQLAAVNEKGQTAVAETGGALPQGTFTTAPSLAPQASSGGASGVGTTTATISGRVNPDGLPATYSFELGVYEGAATQYGVISSGPAGAGSTPVEETLALSGLQPGLTYAFRIAVHSGYIPGEGTLRGAPALFTTGGVASILASPASLPMLATPSIAFPTEAEGATITTTMTKGLTVAQRLAKALKQCEKDRSRSERKRCEKTAHNHYKPAKKTRSVGR